MLDGDGNVTYPCDQCEYKEKWKVDLKIHIESVHGNITYPCDQCKYKAKQKVDLKMYIQSVHGNVTYPCQQCKYKEGWGCLGDFGPAAFLSPRKVNSENFLHPSRGFSTLHSTLDIKKRVCNKRISM